MKFIKENILLGIVFITGACVLILEILAVRILSPYYGSTVYTVSSVLSVILGALSVGYYFGGKLADRYPFHAIFYGLIATAGVCVFITQILVILFLPNFGYQFSVTTGGLIASMTLFFLPALLLGTMSPFAITLQKLVLPNKGLGIVSGGVFFWSTLGSIVGSLLTGFVLIPKFGVNAILGGVGGILTALGLSYFLFALKDKKIRNLVFFLILAIFGCVYVFSVGLSKNSKIVLSKDGVYERITILDTAYRGHQARFFQQDRSNSGAMYLDSDELVFDYSKYFQVYKIFQPNIKKTLVIGGGAYSLPKAILAASPDVRVDVSEIEPTLYDLAKQYFRLRDDPRMENHIQDGRRFLFDTQQRYDLIFVDAYYSLYSVPVHLTTREFFDLAQQKLNENGIFIGNFIGSLAPEANSMLLSSIKTFQSVFPNSYFFAVDSTDSLDPQNFIFVGYKSIPELDLENPEIKNHPDPIIASLPDHVLDLSKYDFTEHLIFTDDYAPVEHLTSIMIKAIPR